MERTHLSGYGLMVLASLLFAGAFVSGKMAVVAVAPEVVAFLRFLIAAVIMVSLVAFMSPAELRIRRIDIPLLCGIGLTSVAGYNLFLLWGFRLAQASDGGMIVPTVAPLATMLLASLFFGEALTARKLTGALICTVGQVLIFYGVLSTIRLTPERGWGALLFTAAAVCWTAYGLLGRLTAGRLTPLAANAWGLMFGSLILLPFALVRLPTVSATHLTSEFWWNMAYLSVGTTVLGFWCFYTAIKQIGAGRAALFLNLVPPAVVALATLMLGERAEAVQLAGMGVVLAGILLANTVSSRNRGLNAE